MSIAIAIVEDDNVYQLYVQSFLKQSGDFTFKLFSTGSSFQQEIQNSYKPDVVILDNNLPDSSGIELLQEIKATIPDAEVLLTSAQQDVTVVVEAYKQGAYRYIIKNKGAKAELLSSINSVTFY